VEALEVWPCALTATTEDHGKMASSDDMTELLELHNRLVLFDQLVESNLQELRFDWLIESEEKHEKKTELLQDAKAYSAIEMLEVRPCALTATTEDRGEVASLDHMMKFMAKSDMPDIHALAQPTPRCKTPPRTPPRTATQMSRLWTIHEEEPVVVAPQRLRAASQPLEMQRPSPIQLLRKQNQIRAKQEEQDRLNDANRIGVLAELIELKRQLEMKSANA